MMLKKLTECLAGVWRDTASATLIITIAFTALLLDRGDVYLRLFASQIGGSEMPHEALRLALVGAHALFVVTILPVIAALSAVIRGAVIAATVIRRTIRVRRGLRPASCNTADGMGWRFWTWAIAAAIFALAFIIIRVNDPAPSEGIDRVAVLEISAVIATMIAVQLVIERAKRNAVGPGAKADLDRLHDQEGRRRG